MNIDYNLCLKASHQIKKYLVSTPCILSPVYSELLGHEIHFKYENKMRTGSFKERGALNSLLNLSETQKKHGVCCASAGNHALALSYHAARLGITCEIVMPTQASLVKIQASKKNGANVILFGETLAHSMQHAREISRNKNYKFISPYDDLDVIAGQSSCASEILEQCPNLENIIVPVGGGGLISGISTVLKAQKPKIKIFGVQSEWAQDARDGKHHDQNAIRPKSIADGIAVKYIGELNQPIIDKNVDRLISVSEAEIAEGLIQFLELERTVIEGAAAAAIAALKKNILPKKSKCSVVVISGSNIDMNTLSRLIERDMAEKQRLLRITISLPDRPGTLALTTDVIAQEGGNILQVHHDRSFSQIPGNVEITFVIEVRNVEHKNNLIEKLKELGMNVKELIKE